MRDSVLQDDLNTALEAIRGGMPVQKAAAEFGKKKPYQPTASLTIYSCQAYQAELCTEDVRRLG